MKTETLCESCADKLVRNLRDVQKASGGFSRFSWGSPKKKIVCQACGKSEARMCLFSNFERGEEQPAWESDLLMIDAMLTL
jgi:hypothetical protein